ncbi:hypothetical protein, partial [Salmonella enterica]|uniref:hypothetical protein n=1 Tax=Salmonella enterica TaxID=28901 RepID=UPI001BAEF06C
IRRIGNLNDEMMQVQKRISDLEVKIKKQDVDAQELQRHLADLSRNLDKMERERREHQRQLDELNDRSAGRIILSILCLGLG